MARSLCLVLAAALALALPAVAFAGIQKISGVPNYPQYEGCGPTAAGMIIGYWDSKGFSNLIPDSSTWSSSTSAAINTMIASPEHFSDYVGKGTGVDAPLPHHPNNSVADFMQSSAGALADGTSYENMQVYGLVGYAQFKGYSGAVGKYEDYLTLRWDDLVAAVNANQPVELYVASTTSGVADHFVTVTGYDDTPDAHKYFFYDGLGDPEQEAPFAFLEVGKQWSVKSGTFFYMTPEPATLALLVLGGAAIMARRRTRNRRIYV
jgi:hypothetical protein